MFVTCVVALSMATTRTAASSATTPQTVALESAFDEARFQEPEAILWPSYFWLWNAPLDEDLLRHQLKDMAAHEARSVCMLPMPRGFRPDSTNNSMDPDYLTPEYFARVRFAVSEASRLGMNWWLYDEGGWPSGQAVGRVTESHPEFGQCRLVREPVTPSGDYVVPQEAIALAVEGDSPRTLGPGDTWSPQTGESAWVLHPVTGGYADLLNPDCVRRFIELTHNGYRDAIGEFFGNTVRFAFTDEPNAPNLRPPESIPWTSGMAGLWEDRFGRPIRGTLPALFKEPSLAGPIDDSGARVAFYDLWTARFRDAYFLQIRDWCREAGLGAGGHLNGEDETVNAVRYGFGHALRQLRAEDVPGVDVIWRQLFPGKPNQHHFPKYASSACHQNGTRFAFSESFCVYGNGLTPAQMKWLVDYQYVRGINLLVLGCYPLSTQDHQMTGERPHFGPVNPLWDHLPGFHAYTARLGYALSVGRPRIATALYYPVRDLWARGEQATDAVQTHDQLAAELLAHQCDFDLIDDDLLVEATVEAGTLVAGAMRYDTLVCGAVQWMEPDVLEKVRRFEEAGGSVLCVSHIPGSMGVPGDSGPGQVLTLGEIAAQVSPTLRIEPPCGGMRVAARSLEDGSELAFLFNEGNEDYVGACEAVAPNVAQLDPLAGTMATVMTEAGHVPVRLMPGDSVLFMFATSPNATDPQIQPSDKVATLDSNTTAHSVRRWEVGEHDFMISEEEPVSEPLSTASRWSGWLGPDFSGEVEYTSSFEVPKEWAAQPLQLETGPIEYGATIMLDGKHIGHILWPPWTLGLPPCAQGPHELVIRVANTLANELTSERGRQVWSSKSGPGWPSLYHERALEFEKESRGGGLTGPIRVRLMKASENM